MIAELFLLSLLSLLSLQLTGMHLNSPNLRDHRDQAGEIRPSSVVYIDLKHVIINRESEDYQPATNLLPEEYWSTMNIYNSSICNLLEVYKEANWLNLYIILWHPTSS